MLNETDSCVRYLVNLNAETENRKNQLLNTDISVLCTVVVVIAVVTVVVAVI